VLSPAPPPVGDRRIWGDLAGAIPDDFDDIPDDFAAYR
jgi:hypothetical protein